MVFLSQEDNLRGFSYRVFLTLAFLASWSLGG